MVTKRLPRSFTTGVILHGSSLAAMLYAMSTTQSSRTMSTKSSRRIRFVEQSERSPPRPLVLPARVCPLWGSFPGALARDHFTGRFCFCGGRLLNSTVDFGQGLCTLPRRARWLKDPSPIASRRLGL